MSIIIITKSVVAIAVAVGIFMSCPYLHDSTYAAQVDCNNGYDKACVWLQRN